MPAEAYAQLPILAHATSTCQKKALEVHRGHPWDLGGEEKQRRPRVVVTQRSSSGSLARRRRSSRRRRTAYSQWPKLSVDLLGAFLQRCHRSKHWPCLLYYPLHSQLGKTSIQGGVVLVMLWCYGLAWSRLIGSAAVLRTRRSFVCYGFGF